MKFSAWEDISVFIFVLNSGGYHPDPVEGIPQGNSTGASSILNAYSWFSWPIDVKIPFYADDRILYRQIKILADTKILQNDLEVILKMGENMENTSTM